MTIDYPFPFLGHGVTWHRKGLGCHLFFAQPPDSRILANLPPVLAANSLWDRNHLRAWSGDDLHRSIVHPSDAALTDPSDPRWVQLQQAFDDAVTNIHHEHPIALAIKSGRVAPSEWHAWSLGQIDRVVSVLEDFDRSSPWFGQAYVRSDRAARDPRFALACAIDGVAFRCFERDNLERAVLTRLAFLLAHVSAGSGGDDEFGRTIGRLMWLAPDSEQQRVLDVMSPRSRRGFLREHAVRSRALQR